MSDQKQEHTEISPGNHPKPHTSYVREYRGKRIHVFPDALTNPIADPQEVGHEAFLGEFLRSAIDNQSIPRGFLDLLVAAIKDVSRVTPDAMGIVGPASYSGPGATGLTSRLRHATRGYAFAAELITAAHLINHQCIAGNRKDGVLHIRPLIDRVDCGIKIVAQSESSTRKTVEADVFVAHPEGYWTAIDIKHSRNFDTYRGSFSESQFSGIVEAIKRREINTFHFVTNGYFSDRAKRLIESVDKRVIEIACDGGVFWHECVWPISRQI